jgi:hypothetical protein
MIPGYPPGGINLLSYFVSAIYDFTDLQNIDSKLFTGKI